MDAFTFSQLLSEAISSALTPRQSRILHLRLGLTDGQPRTLEEIGREIGVSRERIRQLLVKLPPALRRRSAKDFEQGVDSAPALLFEYLSVAIRSDGIDLVPIVVKFCAHHLPTLPIDRLAGPLVANQIFTQQSLAKDLVERLQDRQREITKHVRHERRKASRDRALGRLQQRFDQLLRFTIQPDAGPDLDALRRLKPCRAINRESIGKAGDFKSGKLGRNVEFESESERRFMERLELLDSIEWYVEQPLSIVYRCSILQITRHYHPDLLFISRGGRATVVEIKPIFHMALRNNLDKWRAARQHLREMGVGFLVTDGRICIQELRQHAVPQPYRTAVLDLLDRGDIGWPQYNKAVAHLSTTVRDFAGLVLQENLCWTIGPFRLSRGR